MALPVSASPSPVSLPELTSALDELVTNSAFEDYQLRVTEPKLCDTSVKQYSGYLDITTGKHLFFWYVCLAF
jgi:hypothetical protein